MGLSTSDVVGLAETLAAGKHPKVVFTEAAGQIAGKTGKVMSLEEPAEGDFVTVRFGHDELPFSAADLRMPKRGEFTRKTAPKQTATPAATPAPQGPPLLTDSDNGRAHSARFDNARIEKETTSMSDVVPAQSTDSGAVTAEVADASPAPAPRKKPAKVKAAPELTVTLAYKDGEWTAAAAKGSKVIAKPVPVKAVDAVKMVESLDSPAVSAVVEDIVESARHAAEDEAERLRQQLAMVEARLAELS